MQRIAWKTGCRSGREGPRNVELAARSGDGLLQGLRAIGCPRIRVACFVYVPIRPLIVSLVKREVGREVSAAKPDFRVLHDRGADFLLRALLLLGTPRIPHVRTIPPKAVLAVATAQGCPAPPAPCAPAPLA